MKNRLLTAGLSLLVHIAFGQQLTMSQRHRLQTSVNLDTVTLRVYTKLAKQYKFSPQVDSILYWADKGLVLARHYKMPLAEGDLLLLKGYAYKRYNKYASAQTYYLQALQLIKPYGSISLHGQSLYYLATIYGDQGMYDKVTETATASLVIAQQVRDTLLMNKALPLLSAAYLDQHNLPLALFYARRYMALVNQWVRQHPDQAEALQFAQSTLATTYEAQGYYTRAYPLRKNVLEYFKAQGDLIQLSEAVTLAGMNLIRQQHPQQALHLLNESINHGWVNTKANARAYTDELYALAYQQMGQQALALQYAQSAYKHAQSLGHLKLTQSTLQTLLTIEESQKLYASALAHLRNLMVINDSLLIRQKSDAIASIGASYQVKEYKQTIRLLQDEAALKKIKLEKTERS